ncbi:MAG: hypothetical protein ACKVVP_01830 [Chloroflexota bacterium]
MEALLDNADCQKSGKAQSYQLYGLSIQSDILLPVPAERMADRRTPDVVIKQAPHGRSAPAPDGPMISREICEGPCHNGAPYFSVHRGPGGAWLWNGGVGTCHIAPGERRVDVYPEPDVDGRVIGLFVLGQVLTFILCKLGFPTLHASAVDTDRGAVVFLGPKGQGKSTMAAAFVHRRAPLLTDDVLPMKMVNQDVYGIPGPAIMKVWPATALHTLGIPDGLPDLHPHVDKKLLTLDGAVGGVKEPVRLHAVYVLQRSESANDQPVSCTFQSLSGSEAIAALLSQLPAASYYLSARETALFLPFFSRLAVQTKVRMLRYPNGFQHHDMVYAKILADMERP